jgi:hypothetical protein
MKKKGINKQLLEAELKKYKLMSEYSFYVPDNDDDNRNLLLGSSVNEDGETDGGENIGNPDNEQGGEQQNQGNQPNGQPSEEGANMNTDPNQPPMDGEQQPAPEDVPPMGNEPQPEPEGDEVELDVTELVNGTQEAKASADIATRKMEELLSKFNELESKLGSMDGISTKIEDLERQIEKRNPTPDEKLEMRSFDSYPYNIKLTDYWAEKEGPYNVLDDSSEKEYTLTQDDIKGEYNDNQIKDSFKEFDEEEF